MDVCVCSKCSGEPSGQQRREGSVPPFVEDGAEAVLCGLTHGVLGHDIAGMGIGGGLRHLHLPVIGLLARRL